MTFGLKVFVVAAVVAIISSLSSTSVEAHGYISYPKASFYSTSNATNYAARFSTMQTRSAFHGLKWDDSPVNNAATFSNAFNASGFASLKAMVDGFAPGCQAVNVRGTSVMKWQNDQYLEGFIESHRGPCEIWIGSKRVFHNDDCRATYTSYPAGLPVNYAYCKTSTCVLTFYWLALHEPMWQVYKQCVPITTAKTS